MTVYITGVTEDKYLIVRKGRDRPEVHVKKNGVYSFEGNNYFFGFGVSKVGDCNISIIQLPTSILKDISGNENHSYIYGSKGKLNSGVGIYPVDFTMYNGDVINSYTCKLTFNKRNFGIAYNKLAKDVESYTVKVTGIKKEVVRFTYRNEEGIEKDIRIKTDGIYTLPKCYKEGTTGTSTTYVIDSNYDDSSEIIIKQIPDYPDQICYDGKMYAVSYDFPILTDYTVMADRTWFDINTIFINNTYLDDAENRGFLFEQIKSEDTVYSTSYGVNNVLNRAPNGICYQSKNSYNGTHINSGSKRFIDIIVIGAYLNNTLDKFAYSWKGCHGDVMIFNRTLSSDEIKAAKALMLSDGIN